MNIYTIIITYTFQLVCFNIENLNAADCILRCGRTWYNIYSFLDIKINYFTSKHKYIMPCYTLCHVMWSTGSP